MAKKKAAEKLTPIPRPGRRTARKEMASADRPAAPALAPDLSKIAEGLRPLAVPIDQLHFDPANARRHFEKSVSAIAASLRVYGQCKPVVCRQDTGIVIAGNGTLQAALSLGWTHLAAVRVAFDPATAAGFAIADNRTAELSEWDKQALDQLLREVSTGNDPRLDEMLADLAKKQGLVPGEDQGDKDQDAKRDAANPVAVKWQVLIDCKDESEQAELLERLRAEGHSCHGKNVF